MLIFDVLVVDGVKTKTSSKFIVEIRSFNISPKVPHRRDSNLFVDRHIVLHIHTAQYVWVVTQIHRQKVGRIPFGIFTLSISLVYVVIIPRLYPTTIEEMELTLSELPKSPTS